MCIRDRIGMIPEGLVLLTSTVMAVSVVRLSRRRVLVQELSCIEALARVDVLCLDKTGTLTQGRMELQEVRPCGGVSASQVEQALRALCAASQDDDPTFAALRARYGRAAADEMCIRDRENIVLMQKYDENLWESTIRKCGIERVIESLPLKEQTPIYKFLDDNGVEFSGGEGQKIAIARALYKRSQCIILDEPLAALDPISEYEMYKSLSELIENKTSIFVSHRLSLAPVSYTHLDVYKRQSPS